MARLKACHTVQKSGPGEVVSGFGSVKRLDVGVGGRQLLRQDTRVTCRIYFTLRRARSQSAPAPSRARPAERDAPLISGTATGVWVIAASGATNTTAATVTTNTQSLTRLVKSLRMTPHLRFADPVGHSNPYAVTSPFSSEDKMGANRLRTQD